MMRTREEIPATDFDGVFSGARRVRIGWPGLGIEYAWLPPFKGVKPLRPNRLEVVFSAHSGVALEQDHTVYDVSVVPGALYVVGDERTTLLNVNEYSDTLEIYPDISLLRSIAETENICDFELQPTLHGQGNITFSRDPVALGVAHVLRRACMKSITLSDIEASTLTHLLAWRVLRNQYGVLPPRSRAIARLGEHSMRKLTDFIEEHLASRITLDDMAVLVRLSPFHFARSFKRATGLAPHRYVLARRIDLAKRLLMTTDLPVLEIAASIGFENISHFRRQFAAHLGVVPGALRRATLMRNRSDHRQR